MQHKCLTIAGFDGSGGAGLQADLKTFSALGSYGMTVLTALPIQNTCGVRNCYELPLTAIQEQLEVIFDDIIPDCIKIGMLFSRPIIELVASFLRHKANNIPIVIDPVMFAKSGHSLLLSDAIEALKTQLIPLATILTPNLPEAYVLAGEKMTNFIHLGHQIMDLGAKAVLLKGGHSQSNSSDDLFLDTEGQCEWIKSRRINSNNTHGTGCTLSAAICAFIVKGFSLFDSCKYAKHYLFNAMLGSQNEQIGKGQGPVHHFYHIWPILKNLENNI